MDREWLKPSEMSWGEVESGWGHTWQEFGSDEEERYEYLHLLRNEEGIRVVEKFSVFSAKSGEGTREIAGSNVLLARVDA